jgi:hypothetical protein
METAKMAEVVLWWGGRGCGGEVLVDLPNLVCQFLNFWV